MTQPRQPQGISTEAIERATHRQWAEWLRFMDGIGAADLSHAHIARKVEAELGASVDNPAWWAQGITVAYEQHTGRRKPGQRADGTFQTSISRTTEAGIHEAMARWVVFAAGDSTVQGVVSGATKVSGSEKRQTWRAKAADGSSVMFTSELKPNGKTAVLVNHTRLKSQEEIAAAKQRWAAVLERFVRGL